MSELRTVGDLCAEHHLDLQQLAERAGVAAERVEAILQGRWTPSLAERDRIAAVFGLARSQIAWGHSNPVQHLYGHGPQFGRTP
jgi:transcriptional regulator with XRE-family HTH domain